MERRHDIDFLRVIAIGLLLIYHVTISFQPWGVFFHFIQSAESLESFWIPMALINIWRIPILFFISGMGVFFAIQKRDWKMLFIERSKRIIIPLVFGIFVIVPIHILLIEKYYHQAITYSPNTGHLWFLVNIIVYLSILWPFFYMIKNKPDAWLMASFQKLLKYPIAIYLLIIPFVLEILLVRPDSFSMFLFTPHGWINGFVAFFLGFYFVALGDLFWKALDKTKFLNLALSISLYLVRLLVYELKAPLVLTSIESMLWIFTLFGLCYRYLNKPSKALAYLSQAAYPVYIVHMAFQYLACYLILPMDMSTILKYVLIIIFTFAGSLAFYDLGIRRLKYIRPLFGLKYRK